MTSSSADAAVERPHMGVDDFELAFTAIDSHTEGMPTRVITGGVGTLPGATMLERKLRFMRDQDHIRGC